MTERYKKWLDLPRAATDSYVVVSGSTLKVADCNRSISLEFSYGKWDSRTRAQALRKLNVLRQALDVLEDNIRGPQE